MPEEQNDEMIHALKGQHWLLSVMNVMILRYLVDFTEASSAQQVQQQITFIQGGVVLKPEKH